MFISLIYLIIICSAIAFPILIRVLYFLKSGILRHVYIGLLRHIVYPLLHRRTRIIEPLTRGQSVMTVCYMAATLFFNIWKVSTRTEASSRAGMISIVNIIPLLISSRSSLAAKLFGVNTETVVVVHKIVGFLISIQAAVHTVLVTRLSAFDLQDRLLFYGILVCYSFPEIYLSCLCL